MKFTVEIELGNDAMQTYQDIRDALKEIILSAGSCASSHAQPTHGDGAKVRDENGNTVGSWGVTATPAELATGNINPAIYHVFDDLDGTGFCSHCGMRKRDTDANHVE